MPGGKFIQIEVRVGDATVMLADEFPNLAAGATVYSRAGHVLG